MGPNHVRAESTTRGRRLGYIPSLDGVRAVAVVLTSLVHLVPASVPGGFLGVDIFFVLSGFLITSILIDAFAAAGRVDLRAFYLRRARRLLPAVALLLLVFLIVQVVTGPDLHRLIVSAVVIGGVLTYTFNWSDALGHQPPWQVDHLWSLSVEEQFYLAWPILLVALLKRVSHRTIMRVTASAAVASAVAQAAIYASTHSVAVAYLGSPFHAQGILLGCVLAQVYAWRRADSVLAVSARSKLLPAVAIATIVALAVVLDLDRLPAYAGGMSLAALAAAVLIWSLVGRETLGVTDVFSRVFGSRVFVAVGKRSYSIYLWQNFVAWSLSSTLRGTWLWIPANVIATFSCSEISYRFVERRFLRPAGRAGSVPRAETYAPATAAQPSVPAVTT